tara:strand:- start:1967 stop:2644 length:678 start_codon:yes stop_codon:yes gene_type:complete
MSIQINGTTGISGVNGTAGSPAIQGSDTNTGISFGTDEVLINTGGTERAKIDANGYLRLAAGGIQFKGDTAAANALEEYEEGTWTPVFSSNTATDETASIFSSGYAYQNGFYTRIGRTVTCACYMQLSGNTPVYTNGGSTSSYIVIAGLPYVVSNGVGHFYTGAVSNFGGWTWSPGYTPTVYAQNNKSYAWLTYAATGGSGTITASYLDNANASLLVSFTYFTDQ